MEQARQNDAELTRVPAEELKEAQSALPTEQKTSILFEDISEWNQLQHLYNSALRQLQIKFEILNGEFRVKYARSPIHHIESRMKSSGSIVKKLTKRGFEVSIESAKQNLNDIAGIRVVCCYIDDVYSVADMLLRQSDIELVESYDYIKKPNFNGYRSLHLDIRIPIYLSDRTEFVRAEVQLRSVAMDFWASLEHDLRYKSDKQIPAEICDEMFRAAEDIAAIDRKMQEIYKKIQQL